MQANLVPTGKSAAKTEILRKIRKAIGVGSDAQAIAAERKSLQRGYRDTTQLSDDGVLDLLEHRLKDYDAQVVRVIEDRVAEMVAVMLAKRGNPRMIVPAGLPVEWQPEGFEFAMDEAMPIVELNGMDGVLTGSTLAIAETGTIVLQNGAGQGRRALTLVPDYQLCIVRQEDIVATVPQAMRRLQSSATLATTFVSGPSATADIEMTRIKGVHGPRFLDVILIQRSERLNEE